MMTRVRRILLRWGSSILLVLYSCLSTIVCFHFHQENPSSVASVALHVVHAATATTTTTATTDADKHILPPWLQEYFIWHGKQLSNSNDDDKRFLILRCLAVDDKCGGAADRLTVLPVALLYAAQTQRILLIHWSRPCALQEFLIPTTIWNWTVPEQLLLTHKKSFQQRRSVHIVHDNHLRHYYRLDREQKEATNSSVPTLLHMRYQSGTHGMDFFREHDLQPPQQQQDWNQLYRSIFFATFQPSPAVLDSLITTIRSLDLIPHEYLVVHIRAKYYRDKSKVAAETVADAVDCVRQQWKRRQQQQQNGPTAALLVPPKVLVVSDSPVVLTAAAQEANVVVPRTSSSTLLHLDRGSAYLQKQTPNWDQFGPEQYIDLFVDLFLLAYSQCISLDKGGFGRFGRLLMMNPACAAVHGKQTCEELGEEHEQHSITSQSRSNRRRRRHN